MLELLLTPWPRIPVTALFVAMMGFATITAFAIESLQTGAVWTARGMRTRGEAPTIFWSYMAIYGSGLGLAMFVVAAAIARFPQ